MQFKPRNLRPIAEMVVGNLDHRWFQYRSSFYITRFFEECEMDFAHDGSERSQIMFMDREHILNLYTAHRLELPKAAQPAKAAAWGELGDDVPF